MDTWKAQADHAATGPVNSLRKVVAGMTGGATYKSLTRLPQPEAKTVTPALIQVDRGRKAPIIDNKPGTIARLG